MNAESSRSHAVVILYVDRHDHATKGRKARKLVLLPLASPYPPLRFPCKARKFVLRPEASSASLKEQLLAATVPDLVTAARRAVRPINPN